MLCLAASEIKGINIVLPASIAPNDNKPKKKGPNVSFNIYLSSILHLIAILC